MSDLKSNDSPFVPSRFSLARTYPESREIWTQRGLSQHPVDLLRQENCLDNLFLLIASTKYGLLS
jgi:hypothetical protein